MAGCRLVLSGKRPHLRPDARTRRLAGDAGSHRALRGQPHDIAVLVENMSRVAAPGDSGVDHDVVTVGR
jgi:hypothetical protein